MAKLSIITRDLVTKLTDAKAQGSEYIIRESIATLIAEHKAGNTIEVVDFQGMAEELSESTSRGLGFNKTVPRSLILKNQKALNP